MSVMFKKISHYIPVLVGLFISGLVVTALYVPSLNWYITGTTSPVALAEHNEFFATNPSFAEMGDYMENVARERGGAYAFEVLKNGDLPPGMDTHLLGHFVGDIMYEQEGIEGMRYCDEAVGYACAHSVVINALIKDGPAVFDIINDICASIGIAGSYDMCFHGFGHGVLAYTEFNLPDAIELCGRVGTEEYWNYEEEECLGGVVMEMRGGIHDPDLWEVNGKQYLDPENPLAMCQADYMPPEYREMCYMYITPFIFDHESPADIPPPSVYDEAMAWCEQAETEGERNICYAGFGKEYVGFALGRDIRYLNDITPAQVNLVYDWCGYAASEEGERACLLYAMYGVYRAGSVGFDGALTFCSQSRSQAQADMCYENLFRTANQFHGNAAYEEAICTATPANRQEQCHFWFSDE